MERTETTENVLLTATIEPIASLDLLLEQCLAGLTAHLWQTCCWPDSPGRWTIGDFRFSIVEFEPAPDVSLYIQLWSEPDEQVLVEVSSGCSNPGALKYVWRTQRKALAERGFTVGGAARNFQKEVAVTSPEDAETLARDMLAIVFDVFGYRGEQPLRATLHRGSRAERRPVHMSLSPEDFTKIAEQCGFAASIAVADSSAPVVMLQRGAVKSLAILGAPIPRRNLFRAVMLRATVGDSSTMTVPDANGNDAFLVSRFVVDGDERIAVEAALSFDGGVTTEWVGRSLVRWRRMVRKYQRLLNSRPQPTIRGPRLVRQRMSIH